MNEYFKVIRGGINSTFQDEGRKNFYHIGLPFSGVMDKRNFKIANTIMNNQKDYPVLEFAYQGPSLKYFGNKRYIVITGDVNIKIIKNDKKETPGKCYKTIEIDNGDIIDIISTNQSVYGYFAVNGGFKINKVWKSYATTVRAEVGPNKGNKLLNGQNINLNKSYTIQNRS